MPGLRVLVVGCGHMGAAHARVYRDLAGFEIAGLVARRAGPRDALAVELGVRAVFADFDEALASTRPDAVCIATYPDTHARFCLAALAAGAHVFVEKPLAPDMESAERMVRAAQAAGRALVVGYILRHHPAWTRFIALGRELGRPLVMRISQNQQSRGPAWQTQQRLMASVSPIVDCAVHYLDVMCQMVDARPVQVQAIGARLTEVLPAGMYNYGHLQVRFADGSVGWYEAGWGPMMSRPHFLRDVVGPAGSLTMTQQEAPGGPPRTVLVRHAARLDEAGAWTDSDQVMNLDSEPTLADLCRAEQEFFAGAIGGRVSLAAHHEAALLSLRLALAADRSIREGGVAAI